MQSQRTKEWRLGLHKDRRTCFTKGHIGFRVSGGLSQWSSSCRIKRKRKLENDLEPRPKELRLHFKKIAGFHVAT